MKRKTIRDFVKRPGSKLVCLTAYTAPVARIANAHADLLLVGDSVGMVLYGFPSTLQVTLDMMINHGAAVVRSSAQALVIVDMPFGSYQESPEQAFRNASRIMSETGCNGVKLEGGSEMAQTVAFLTQRASLSWVISGCSRSPSMVQAATASWAATAPRVSISSRAQR